jgi:hypothetical protein
MLTFKAAALAATAIAGVTSLLTPEPEEVKAPPAQTQAQQQQMQYPPQVDMGRILHAFR